MYNVMFCAYVLVTKPVPYTGSGSPGWASEARDTSSHVVPYQTYDDAEGAIEEYHRQINEARAAIGGRAFRLYSPRTSAEAVVSRRGHTTADVLHVVRDAAS